MTNIKDLDLTTDFKLVKRNKTDNYNDYCSNTHSVKISTFDQLRYLVEVGFSRIFFYKNSLKKCRDPRKNTHEAGWVLEDNGNKAICYNKKADAVNVFTKEYCRLRDIEWSDVLAKF